MNIDTARVRLRPVASVDVDDLLALDSDPEVMRYVSGGVGHRHVTSPQLAHLVHTESAHVEAFKTDSSSTANVEENTAEAEHEVRVCTGTFRGTRVPAPQYPCRQAGVSYL